MKDVKIILSRYNEDISWSDKYADNRIIYNKGDEILQPNIKLSNIGREGHTYLYHIVNNYDNLSDYNIFLQGKPHDHVPDIENIINSIIFSDSKDFFFISNWWIETDFYYIREPYRIPYVNFIEQYKLIFDEYPSKDYFLFGANGQFCVSKKNIQKRPLSFYKKYLDCFEGKNQKAIDLGLMNHIDGDFRLNDPILGHHAERLWGFVFDV